MKKTSLPKLVLFIYTKKFPYVSQTQGWLHWADTIFIQVVVVAVDDATALAAVDR